MSTDFRTQLESSLARSYTIESELSGGGMARVFLATDRSLGRRVVIKVLRPELAAEVSSKRFAREIRLAASLQQANIVPVLSAGEADGLPLYVMPFVEGLSLRNRLDREGRPLLTETIGVLRDIARALAYAHEHGVVHRDIKPENVLLSGDAAVVTDFGIAKAIASSRLAESGLLTADRTVTQAGTALGTPAYMAPEQISGDPAIDHRADLYSFGCVAYEMLSGSAPFEGHPVHALFAAHLSERPIPVGERNPDTPPALASIVMQCLEKDPDARPQSARDVLRVIEGDTAPATGIARLRQRLSQRQRRAALATVAVVAAATVVGIAVVLWPRSIANERPPALATVAVVPFLNLSGDSADEYLADGMADGLATALGKLGGIRVVSRSLSYRYKGQRVIDARDLGRTLAVSHVLTGGVRRVGDRLRLSASLTKAADNEEVWSEDYDRNAADAFAVQDEITARIANALGSRIGGGAASVIPKTASSGTSNPDAYDLYLRGRYLLQRRGRGVRQSSEKFAQAIAKDSNFARAYAALAFSLELLPYFELVKPDSIGRVAIPAARRALSLDSTLAEAHTALALGHHHAYEWRDAEVAHRQAIRLDSTDVDAHIQYGRFLHYNGRLSEAQAEFERARALDPYSAVASGWVGHLMDLRGHHREAVAELRRALEIDSTNPPSLLMLAEAHWYAGRRDAAKVPAEQIWRLPLPLWRLYASSLFALMGDRERARRILAALDSAPAQAQFHTNRATLLLGLGDTSAVMDEMQRATAAREPWPTTYSLSERRFDVLRGSSRFRAIVRSVGLDERIFTSPTGGRPQ
jgi:serine/threonine-protein kinase